MQLLLDADGDLGQRIRDPDTVATVLDRPGTHALACPLLLHALLQRKRRARNVKPHDMIGKNTTVVGNAALNIIGRGRTRRGGWAGKKGSDGRSLHSVGRICTDSREFKISTSRLKHGDPGDKQG